ncbi:putative transcriptional regulator [Propionicimonas paludicola]|uniref:Putative transcriptional regulator n=1 Tax=Propionicimonas paludicola TaxID=185243 RepID=A0A2A9CRX2_9ACTN|nr:YqgE/AlgH family protein [Propionicimonas paludicola]PFG16352.1 putative transcriptional regulator [Propionicimonas paludicola]
MSGFAVGDLLVAGITISDGVFDGTVVLLVEVDESGTVGVVLNRISELDLGSALPSWAGLVSEPARLFDGGPVSQQGAICLAEPSHAGEEPPGWRPIFGRVGLLNLETPVEIAAGAYRRLRIFAGYAGWDAGQLERELELAMWHVLPAAHDDVFDTQPNSLWRRVLRRQGGELALLSTWTANAELN